MGLTLDERKKKNQNLKEYWKFYFESIEVDFNKVNFFVKSVIKGDYLTFFENELVKGVFYTELVSFSYTPRQERELLKITFDGNETSKYQIWEESPLRHLGEQYKIPLSHFGKVVINNETIEYEKMLNSGSIETKLIMSTIDTDDCIFDQLTGRDIICTLLKVPESNKGWINDLIKKSKL